MGFMVIGNGRVVNLNTLYSLLRERSCWKVFITFFNIRENMGSICLENCSIEFEVIAFKLMRMFLLPSLDLIFNLSPFNLLTKEQ